MKLKAKYFGFCLIGALSLLSCKEAAEGVDQTADQLTGKNQIKQLKKTEAQLNDINKQHNKQLEEATKEK
ncbi:hypothetical protein PQO03_09830 [Lentisphaera profundi]|uniref:Lipoprotein n=1 Tax=Lentisphaera profundi TaxID=1658616 RepID=A0ABY7VT17_9BACT|nr:hypothetical protein [Lentisphaera profundi]WDE96012.1 hypothetical protein PQO03_09830 [Lentisphaera profundi]